VVAILLNVAVLCLLIWAKIYKEYIIEKNSRRYLRYLKRKNNELHTRKS